MGNDTVDKKDQMERFKAKPILINKNLSWESDRDISLPPPQRVDDQGRLVHTEQPAAEEKKVGKKIAKGSGKVDKNTTISGTAIRPAEAAPSSTFHEGVAAPFITPEQPPVKLKIAGAFGEIRCTYIRVINEERFLILVGDKDSDNLYVPPESQENILKIKLEDMVHNVLHIGISFEDAQLLYIILVKVKE